VVGHEKDCGVRFAIKDSMTLNQNYGSFEALLSIVVVSSTRYDAKHEGVAKVKVNMLIL
jgi:hypothetical protein